MECYEEASQASLMLINDLEAKSNFEFEYWLADILIQLGHKKEAERILLEIANDAQMISIWGREIVDHLGKLDPSEAIASKLLMMGRDESLIAICREKHLISFLREGVIRALLNLGDLSGAVQMCLLLIVDEKENGWTRGEAAKTLARIASQDVAIPVLLSLWRDEKTKPDFRLGLAVALCQLGYQDEVNPFLRDMLEHGGRPGGWGRIEVAYALGQQGFQEEVVPVLIELARNWQTILPDTRTLAAKAIYGLGYADKAKAILLEIANHERVRIFSPQREDSDREEQWDKEQRITARLEIAKALGEIGFPEDAFSIFLELIRERLPSSALFGYVERTIDGLSKFGDERASPELERVAQSETTFTKHRHLAKKAIRQIRQRLARNANL
jgi:tetratricopeptide (TPR) repeat protein